MPLNCYVRNCSNGMFYECFTTVKREKAEVTVWAGITRSDDQ